MTPSLVWTLPFVALLLCIAILPLIPRAAHWWEHNRSKLLVAGALGILTCLYYVFRGFGFPHGGDMTEPGWRALKSMLNNAVVEEYIPFIVLLFSLFTISGGINLRGDLPAHPLTNTIFLAVGGLLASFIGTTGAAMLLIRPILQVNSERRHVKHTVVFFIFIVANIGGSLLPIGDPPLFLGYLLGVPFLWTLHLLPVWGFCLVVLLIVYYVWDTLAYKQEATKDIVSDEATRQPLRLSGKINVLFLLGVVLAVSLLVPGKKLAGTNWIVPNRLREITQLALAGLSLLFTSHAIRKANSFNFTAIGEVACLFIGIFLTMQVPIEILNARGAELGLRHPWHFFWASGMLSSVLDNAPTYVVFFYTAGALPVAEGVKVVAHLGTATGQISIPLLLALSCGSVFMGANTYIGNGPNFMVKSIAERSGVRMPSFFGYMLYSGAILIPLFLVVTILFFV